MNYIKSLGIDGWVKWVGNILCLVGIALTSRNYYPEGPILAGVSSCFWLFSAVKNKNIELGILEAMLIIITVEGLFSKLIGY